MSKYETQLSHLIEGLQELQQQLQHNFVDDIQPQFQRLQKDVRKQLKKQIVPQVRRFGRQLGKRLPAQPEQLPRTGIALSLGLLVLGGAGIALARNLRKQQQAKDSLKSAHGLDLNRFSGKWFEIARMPGKHSNVFGTTLNYTLNADNSLDVQFCYRQGSLEGPERTEQKHIHIAQPDNRAQFKKQVFGPLNTDYWVLEIGKNYEYAVLGTPSRKHLWILSRSPKFDQARYEEILQRMSEQGFEIGKLQRVEHDDQQPVALSSHLQALLEQKQQYFKSEEADKHRGPHKHEKAAVEKKPQPHEKREEI